MEMSKLTRDRTSCRTRLARRNSQARTGTGKMYVSLVQLTTTRIGNLTRLIHVVVVVVVDSHIQRIVLATEETTVTQQVTHRPVVVVVVFTLTDRASTIPSNIRGCQSGTTWSQRGTKVNGYQMPIPLVVTKRYQGQRVTSSW